MSRDSYSLNMKVKAISLSQRDYRNVWLIESDGMRVKVSWDDYPNCCEDYGHEESSKGLETLNGRTIVSLTVTSTDPHNSAWTTEKLLPGGFLDNGNTAFVTFTDSAGDVHQLAFYNCNNGHYGHRVAVEVVDLADSDVVFREEMRL